LIVVETALAETVAGAHEPVTRAPAWLASLVALVLLYRLGRSLGLDGVAAAAAATATAATPMFWVYGVMLDTPVTSFPFGVAVILLWFRDWRAIAPDPPAAAQPAPVPIALSGLVSVLAGLAGWQAGLLAVLCGATLAVRAARRRPGALRAALPYLAGAAVGIGLSVAWGWWAYGGLKALSDKFTRRSGSGAGVSPVDVVTFQVPWLFQLLGLGMIGLVAAAVSLRDKVFRPLAAMSLTIVGLYCLLFREAAAGHQYWVYWSLLPTMVGFAYAFRAISAATRDAGLSDTARTAVVVGLAVLLGVIDVGRGSEAEQLITDGEHPVELLQHQTLPPGDAVYYVGQAFRPDSWIVYYTGRHGQSIASTDDLARLARDQPDTPVLILGICDDGGPARAFCERATGPTTDGTDPARWVTADELARTLGVAPAAPVDAGGPPPLPPPTPSAP
jgi:hypothetical protein